MALAPDGKIVVVGYIILEEDYEEIIVARYLGGAGAADLDADGTGDADDDYHGRSATTPPAALESAAGFISSTTTKSSR